MGLTIDKGYPHEGTIDFLENRVNPATGTIRVRGTFPNPRPAVGERVIESGLFARVRVPIGKPKHALLVTDRAIGTDQGRKFVYVVNDKNEVVFPPRSARRHSRRSAGHHRGLERRRTGHHRRPSTGATRISRLADAGRNAEPPG